METSIKELPVKRKGISPLIAAVMLIAFTISIASIAGPWFSELIGGIQEDTSDNTQEVLDTTQADLEIVEADYD